MDCPFLFIPNEVTAMLRSTVGFKRHLVLSLISSLHLPGFYVKVYYIPRITLTTIINYNEGQFAESLQQLRDNYTTVLQNHISTNMFPQQYYSKRSENKEIGELKTKRINPR